MHQSYEVVQVCSAVRRSTTRTVLAALIAGVLLLATACGGSSTGAPAVTMVSGRYISLPNSWGGHPVAFRWSWDDGFAPGMTIVDATRSGGPNNCTIGWPVSSASGRPGYLTAGHCAGGLGGDTWVYTDRNQRRRIYLGPIVEHEDDTLPDGTMFDASVAFLRVSTPPAKWGTTIGVHPIAAVLSPQQVSRLGAGTPICMLGARSGFTCGPLVHADSRYFEWGGYAVIGDSGSALFVVNHDESVCAVGILHDGPTDRDNTAAYVGPVLQRWNLTLHRDRAAAAASGDDC